jgi:hypothetical protein
MLLIQNPYDPTGPKLRYEEVEPWRESIDGGMVRVERSLRCDPGDRWDLYAAFLGTQSIATAPSSNDPATGLTYPSAGKPYVKRSLPHAWVKGKVYAQAVPDATPWGVPGRDQASSSGAGGTPTAPAGWPGKAVMLGTGDAWLGKFTRFKLRYESVDYAVLDDAAIGYNEMPRSTGSYRYVSRYHRPDAQYLTLPFGAYKFVDTPPVNAPQGLPTIQVNGGMSYVWREVPEIPGFKIIQACYTHLGSVNDAVFDGVNPETMLLKGIEVKGPYYKATLTPLYDYTFVTEYFEPETNKGHNYFLRYQGTYTYQLVTSDGTTGGKRIHAKMDWSKLFQPL